MSYEIWLSFNNNEEQLQLPLLPEDIECDDGSQNESTNILGLGEATIIQDPPAMVFSFKSHFPKVWFPSCSYKNIPDPLDAVALIRKWKSSDRPIRFVATEQRYNYPVSIESFRTYETGGDVGSIYYEITLKEYRFITSRKVNQTVINGETVVQLSDVNRPSDKAVSGTYKVRSGDSLWAIAKKQLQDGSRYTDIASLNGIKPDYVIYEGQELRLPV